MRYAVIEIILVCILSTKFVSLTLDIRVNGPDFKNVFLGTSGYIEIISEGHPSSLLQLLKSNYTNQLPVVQPQCQQMRFQFQSSVKLYYSMIFSSSDTRIMKTPTVNISLEGRLETSWIDFEVRFPCTDNLSGVVNMGLIFDFYFEEKRTNLYKRINLSIKRECLRVVVLPPPTENICEKRCDLNSFKRMYCLSDFVARLRITEVNLNTENSHYLVQVTTRKIFRYPTFFIMKKRNQRIESLGLSVTCDCKPLEKGKKYLLFGREDKNENRLFVNRYSLGFEISKNVDLFKEFQRTYQTFKCPPYLLRWFGNRNN